jgi:cob(I)alamin adenosyltransferase
MGNRLTQIATRTGDDGTTGLADNSRVRKTDARIQAIGDVDELNSNLGVLLCEDMPSEVRAVLVEVQHQLFNLGGSLAMPGYDGIKQNAVLDLDAHLEHYNATLPRLQEFILPAGTRAASLAHVCRTVARRAERTLNAFHEQHPVSPLLTQYLNRLSDLLFVLARVLNRMNGGEDVYWRSERLSGYSGAT